MTALTRNADHLLALADLLIPACEGMPAFSAVVGVDDIALCLELRPDVAADFERAIDRPWQEEAVSSALQALAIEDAPALAAFGLIIVSAYYMAPRVRESLGYPGQVAVPIRRGDAVHDLRDDILAQVVARGRRYVPTPQPSH